MGLFECNGRTRGDIVSFLGRRSCRGEERWLWLYYTLGFCSMGGSSFVRRNLEGFRRF